MHPSLPSLNLPDAAGQVTSREQPGEEMSGARGKNRKLERKRVTLFDVRVSCIRRLRRRHSPEAGNRQSLTARGCV